MTLRRKKKLKVAVRRSRVAYQWRTVGQSLTRMLKAVFFVGSATAAAWGAHRVWTSATLSRIAEVRVEGARPRGWSSPKEIRAGNSLLSFSAHALEKHLAREYPDLARVDIHRGWDRGVTIRLALRTPVARQPRGAGWAGVDAWGAVFPLEGDRPDLPVLQAEGAGVIEGLALLSHLRATKEMWTDGLNKLKISADAEAVLYLAVGTVVRWGDALADPMLVAQKARRLSRVFASPEAAPGVDDARFIDDKRIVIRPRSKGKSAHG